MSLTFPAASRVGAEEPVVRRAAPDDAARLTDLALRSKAVWGYEVAFMDACRAELTISRESIRHRPTLLAEDRGRLLGFYQLRLFGPSAEVAHLFIAPEAIGSGFGRRLWRHLERTARAAGAHRLKVDSDPHAEGFYLAIGMVRRGAAPSGSIAGACCRTWQRSWPQRSRTAPPWQVVISKASEDPGVHSSAEVDPIAGGIAPCLSNTVRQPLRRRSPATATASRPRPVRAGCTSPARSASRPRARSAHGAEAQVQQAWRNVLSVLAAAGMGPRDLVKVVTFLIDRADLATARAVRDRMLQGAAPASTLRGSRQPRLADRDRGDRRRGMTRSR